VQQNPETCSGRDTVKAVLNLPINVQAMRTGSHMGRGSFAQWRKALSVQTAGSSLAMATGQHWAPCVGGTTQPPEEAVGGKVPVLARRGGRAGTVGDWGGGIAWAAQKVAWIARPFGWR